MGAFSFNFRVWVQTASFWSLFPPKEKKEEKNILKKGPFCPKCPKPVGFCNGQRAPWGRAEKWLRLGPFSAPKTLRNGQIWLQGAEGWEQERSDVGKSGFEGFFGAKMDRNGQILGF